MSSLTITVAASLIGLLSYLVLVDCVLPASHLFESIERVRRNSKPLPINRRVPSAEEVMHFWRRGHQAERQRRQAVDGSSAERESGYISRDFKEEWPQPPRPSPRDPRKVGCFNFNLARGLNKDDRVQYGILTFFKKCKRAAVAEHGIRRVIVSFVEDDEAATKVFEEDVEISCDAGFQRIRFTPLVAKWARKPHTNRGVCIYAKNEAERRYLSIYSLQNGNLREGRGRNASLSVIYEKNGLRAEPTCSFKYENKTCCRRTQVISIEEIGLSDLIAFPHEYDAFACMGYCLANRYQRSNPVRDGISFLQTTMRTCCRGTRFGSLYIVQYNEVGMPSFQSYDNMTILACQCSEAR